MVQSLDESVAEVISALRKVAGDASGRALASKYIDFFKRYPKRPLSQAKLRELAYFSQGARRNADHEDWDDVLVHAYELLSTLPGDPSSLPIKQPRPPWGR